MKPLITEDERQRLLATVKPVPTVRPATRCPWYACSPRTRTSPGCSLASLDPADGDTAYGLIDLGLGMPELGTVKLSDLASIVGPRQRP